MKIVKELDGTEWAINKLRKRFQASPALTLNEGSIYWTWGFGDDGILYDLRARKPIALCYGMNGTAV